MPPASGQPSSCAPSDPRSVASSAPAIDAAATRSITPKARILSEGYVGQERDECACRSAAKAPRARHCHAQRVRLSASLLSSSWGICRHHQGSLRVALRGTTDEDRERREEGHRREEADVRRDACWAAGEERKGPWRDVAAPLKGGGERKKRRDSTAARISRARLAGSAVVRDATREGFQKRIILAQGVEREREEMGRRPIDRRLDSTGLMLDEDKELDGASRPAHLQIMC